MRVLAKVREVVEVVIEQDHRPIAILRPPQAAGRSITEIVADLEARGSNTPMDDDFARDIEEGVRGQRQPWNPPSWE